MTPDDLKNFDDAVQNRAVKVNIEVSLNRLKEIFRRKSYIIKSPCPTISDAECDVWKDDVGFSFETSDLNKVPTQGQYQSSLYGVKEIEFLEKDNKVYRMTGGPIFAEVQIINRFFGKGRFHIFEHNVTAEPENHLSLCPSIMSISRLI
jgi:hypothetical protein